MRFHQKYLKVLGDYGQNCEKKVRICIKKITLHVESEKSEKKKLSGDKNVNFFNFKMKY